MATAIIQPIAGVSANRETEIEVVYPSIAGGIIGSLIGSLMGIVAAFPPGQGITKPVLLGIKLLLYIALGAVLLPLGLLGYIVHKLLGKCYSLTNRSIQERGILGGAMSQQLALSEIQGIEITTAAGYEFFQAGDLNLQNAQGSTLMTLQAIPNPERLSQILIDAREARLQSDASLAQIQSRG